MRRVLAIMTLLLSACSASPTNPVATSDTSPAGAEPTVTTDAVQEESAEQCADVIDATISKDGDTYTIAATVRSNDLGWDKYADAWQVWDEDAQVLAERVLTHPHETEQPFTRNLSDISLPAGIDVVRIAAHDSVLGFCGDVFTLEVPGQ